MRLFGTQFRSRSGRTHYIRWSTIVLWCTGLVGSVIFVTATLTLYTPVLHMLAGDWTGQATHKYVEKFLMDNGAALLNLLVADEAQLTSLLLPAVDLRVEKNAFDSLNRDIVQFGFGKMEAKPRINGRSRVSGDSLPVSIRYRGTNTWHHQYWKPSLRVRYKNQRIVDGRRDHVLIAPEDGIGMRNWLSSALAQRWGLLSNREEFQLLFINRRFHGLYTNSWRFDESLLIQEHRLPGPFFRLENLSGPTFRHSKANFWQPETWEIIGIERTVGEEMIQVMVDTLREEDLKVRYAQLNEIVDAQAFAKFLAILTHGASIHVNYHNVALWLDTTDGRFRPVIIDVNGYDWSHPGNLQISPTSTDFELASRWLENPENLHLYIATIYELLDTFGAASSMESELREQWVKNRPYVVTDLYFSEMGASNETFTRSLLPVTSADDNLEAMIDAIKQRTSFLRKTLDKTEVNVAPHEEDRFFAQVRGYAGVLVSRRDGRSFAVNGSTPAIDAKLLPITQQKQIPDAGFWLQGTPDDYRFAHLHTGMKIKPADEQRVATLGMVLRHQVAHKPYSVGPGDVYWQENKEFPTGQIVIIQPGTNLWLGPNVSVYVRGPLKVLGSATHPVVIRPLHPDRPFGSFVVLGSGCTAEIRHLDIEGGSTARRLNLHQSGMFSIRDCDRFEITNSRFGENFSGDDGLHVSRSAGVVRASTFENAYSDAIDWDAVSGSISDSVFRNSGNDAIDLSMSTVQILRTTFVGCGDKCVSIGEGSRVSLNNLTVNDCQLGIAVKDASEAVLRNSGFDNCDKTLNTYMKKWRWGAGGTLYVSGTNIERSRTTDIAGDEQSWLFVAQANNWRSAGIAKMAILSEEKWPQWTQEKSP